MAFLNDLINLLGGGQKPLAKTASKAVRPRRQAEDDGLVETPQGMMPLSSVNPGQQWRNPDNGYSPNGYKGLQMAPPVAPRVGAGWNGLQQSSSLEETLNGNTGLPQWMPNVYFGGGAGVPATRQNQRMVDAYYRYNQNF